MKARVTLIVGAIGLCLSVVSLCHGTVVTTGGQPGASLTGAAVVEQVFTIHQGAFEEGGGATDLHFKIWQKEDNIDILKWEISISHFTEADSSFGAQPKPHDTDLVNMPGVPNTNDPDNGLHAVDVEARFTDPMASVPHCTKVTISVKLWLTSYNTIHIADAMWTRNGEAEPASLPDFGWDIAFPVAVMPGGPFNHTLTVSNDGTTPFSLSNVRFMPSTADVRDFTDLSFADANQVGDVDALDPGQPMVTDILTPTDFVGNYIYHTFTIGQFPGDPNASVVTAKHLVVAPPPIPTVSQWGLIIMAALLLTAGVIVIVRRRRQVTA